MPDLVANRDLEGGGGIPEPPLNGDASALWQNLKFSKKLDKRKVNTLHNGLLVELQSWTF